MASSEADKRGGEEGSLHRLRNVYALMLTFFYIFNLTKIFFGTNVVPGQSIIVLTGSLVASNRNQHKAALVSGREGDFPEATEQSGGKAAAQAQTSS